MSFKVIVDDDEVNGENRLFECLRNFDDEVDENNIVDGDICGDPVGVVSVKEEEEVGVKCTVSINDGEDNDTSALLPNSKKLVKCLDIKIPSETTTSSTSLRTTEGRIFLNSVSVI